MNVNAQTEKSSDAVQIPAEAEMLQVAGKLVQYGYENNAALPLIQAVEIYQTVGGNSFTGTKESGTTGEKKDSKVSYDIPQLIADAKELAQNDQALLTLIDGLQSKTTRGATSNYAVHSDVVSANSTDTYKVRFRGGEPACVVISGDGDTDLDVYVYSPNNTLVAKDDDYTDQCVAAWTPGKTQTYTIKVVNRGRVSNLYRMAVN